MTDYDQIYGVEPNTDHHDALRKRIKQEGLSDVYVIVPVGAEDLGSKWVAKGEVDSIITVCGLVFNFILVCRQAAFARELLQLVIPTESQAHMPTGSMSLFH